MVLEEYHEKVRPATFTDLDHARVHVWLKFRIGKMTLSPKGSEFRDHLRGNECQQGGAKGGYRRKDIGGLSSQADESSCTISFGTNRIKITDLASFF